MRPRRKHQRFVRRLETEFVGDNKTYRAFSSDFSRYGIFIRTNHAFVPGTILEITVHLPDGTNCSIRGVVRRALKTPIVSLKNGMGVELLQRDQNYIRFLKECDPAEDGELKSADEIFRHQGQPAFENRPQPETSAAAESVILACVSCGAKNRVRADRVHLGPRCGKCKALLPTHA